ncbi:chorismate mutase [Streptomyces sp. H27-C3]|uniref:chorismate mutase n=1 Tax=Streptomyces sp. H27-C3 TaxID=3046305 RepID=UPI0024BB33E9|nr:chorismate mutase [Streptomyces sp. H27-C3]MDJ0464454.1 chorismate mutase [Streptomyces sp. H27-C3]
MPSTIAGPHTGVPETAPGADDAVATVVRLRHRIDETDGQLIELIEQRIALSTQIQTVRKATGGPHLALAREAQIISRYRTTLGRLGTEVAMLVLRLSRGSAKSSR